MENQLPNKPEEIIQRMINDPNFRLELVRDSHYWFMHFYFPHYVTYPTADFQKEIFQLTESSDRTVVITAFRGSAKSTICTLSYAIWAILGKQGKKFVIMTSQTQRQARQHLMNLKRELESNPLLLRDLGPFHEEQDEWGGYSLVITKYGARITAASSEQSIRGLRHMNYRPDLIIADDIEDLQSTRTKEARDKTYDWLLGDVIPAGDQNTKLIIVGNLLHEDSVMMRLKSSIEEGKIDGVFRAYPIIGEGNKILWPGKYPTLEAVENEKRKTGNESAWNREYLLRIVSDSERVVHPEWIQHYKELPDKDHLRYTATGVDLAISLKETADRTAMVSANIYGYGEDLKIYILPNPINERLTFPQTVDRIKLLSKVLGEGAQSHMYIEEVSYQRSLIEQLNREGYHAEGVKLHGQDKRSRLALTTAMIQNGQIVFPEKGAEDLIQQLTGFGVERFDDLADAFSLLVLKTTTETHAEPNITWIDLGPPRGWQSF
ncbi:MAG: phage terminase large subunit [bacterium]|nr:phage terminase large subunit [bacterium]